MYRTTLLVIVLLVGGGLAQQAPPPGQPPAQTPSPPLPPAVAKADEPEQGLLQVRRIYVDSFGDDAMSKQIHDAIITGLSESKRFIVTENKERADAVLKGTGLEKTTQELHGHQEATAVGTAAGSHSGSVSGSFVNGTGSVSGSSRGRFVAHSAAIEDANVSTETINDARVSVRLVDKDGDVIWATTQESSNAKYKSATADVADKVVKQLLRSVAKMEKAPGQPSTTSPE